jgi:phospholipase/carboxylesterase
MLDCLYVEAEEKHDASVIWMHGLGATSADFVDMPRFIKRPNTRWVFPQSPSRAVTLNNGMIMPSWFDIRYLGGGDVSGERESQEEAKESGDLISELIDTEHESGISYERIVIIGFSQGGAMSLYTGCRFPHKLAGIICLSGYLLFNETHIESSHDANRDTPILIQHGVLDEMVPFIAGERSFEFLSENGWAVEFDSYRMGHEVCNQEIARIGQFISKILD